MKSAFLVVSLLGLPVAAAAQPAERTVSVAVTDEKGDPVQGLSTAEIALVQKGVAREVVSFERDTRPLHLVVLLDTSEPTASAFRLNVPEAVAELVRRMPAGTRTTIYGTGDRPTKLVENATDAAAVTRALGRAVNQGGNRLLDALVEASRDHKAKEGERTAIVVVTGLEVGFSDYDRREVVKRVQDSGAVVHGVTFDEGRAAGSAESGSLIGGSDYEYVLRELAKSTGGSYESALSAMATRKLLGPVAAAVASPYRLTYRTSGDGGDKDLELTVARPGARARVVR